VSILSRQVYSGSFPDLYAYSKSFVADEFPFEKTTVKGFMEYNIMRVLKNVDSVVEAKTLKVFDWSSGEPVVSPKQDWKMTVINAFGLDNKEYTWDDANAFCGDETVKDRDGIIKEVEICKCNYNNGDCEPLLNNSIITEFRRIFEYNTPARLEALTTYPWTIRVKSANITVTNLCNDETFSTYFENPRDYYENSKDSMTIGMPMQFLFGEKSGVEIEGDSRWCDVSTSTGFIGAQCMPGTGSLDVMCFDYNHERTATNTPNNEEETSNTWLSICTTSGVCCPIGYEDYFNEEYTCCKLTETSACTDGQVTKKYECAVKHPTDDYNFVIVNDIESTEDCYVPQSQGTTWGGRYEEFM